MSRLTRNPGLRRKTQLRAEARADGPAPAQRTVEEVKVQVDLPAPSAACARQYENTFGPDVGPAANLINYQVPPPMMDFSQAQAQLYGTPLTINETAALYWNGFRGAVNSSFYFDGCVGSRGCPFEDYIFLVSLVPAVQALNASQLLLPWIRNDTQASALAINNMASRVVVIPWGRTTLWDIQLECAHPCTATPMQDDGVYFSHMPTGGNLLSRVNQCNPCEDVKKSCECDQKFDPCPVLPGILVGTVVMHTRNIYTFTAGVQSGICFYLVSVTMPFTFCTIIATPGSGLGQQCC